MRQPLMACADTDPVTSTLRTARGFFGAELVRHTQVEFNQCSITTLGLKSCQGS